MDYNLLMNLAIDLGYELAMSGAETFRVEESPDSGRLQRRFRCFCHPQLYYDYHSHR